MPQNLQYHKVHQMEKSLLLVVGEGVIQQILVAGHAAVFPVASQEVQQILGLEAPHVQWSLHALLGLGQRFFEVASLTIPEPRSTMLSFEVVSATISEPWEPSIISLILVLP